VYDEELDTRFDTIRVKQNGLYGYLDGSGKVKIPLIYEELAARFQDGRTLAKLNGKWGNINEAGETVIPFCYEKLLQFYPLMSGCKNPLTATVLDGKTGFIDFSGKVVIPFMYDNDFPHKDVCSFNRNGTAAVRLNGKWGVIDTNNRVVAPFKYPCFDSGKNYFSYCTEVDGKKIYIDNVGNEWGVAKNAKAPTLYDILQPLTWEDVESYRNKFSDRFAHCYFGFDSKSFNQLKQAQPNPSDGIIRIMKTNSDASSMTASLFSVKDGHSFALNRWKKLLDYEVRVEDNLQVCAAEIFILCSDRNDMGFWDADDDDDKIFGDGGLEYIEEDWI
jgi:hypothetical protein